jgi:hypothetical protein
MVPKTSIPFMTIVVLSLAGACARDRVQPISGQVALATFDGPVTTVRAVRPSGAAIVAPVGAGGAFQILVPRGKGYHLEFAGPSGIPILVFPHAAGALTWTFDVRGRGTRFDVGTVRYVGNPAGMPVTFVIRQGETLQEPDGGAKENGDDDCEDGKDLKTGAICVDDDDHDKGKGKGDDECEDDDDHDGDCVNGTNAETGAPCKPAPAPSAAAVADRNLPAVMGSCADDDDKDDDKNDDDKNEKDND